MWVAINRNVARKRKKNRIGKEIPSLKNAMDLKLIRPNVTRAWTAAIKSKDSPMHASRESSNAFASLPIKNPEIPQNVFTAVYRSIRYTRTETSIQEWIINFINLFWFLRYDMNINYGALITY
ncbi:hypothetical protein KM043_016663 [Ampulex compressa]|nr:hypothetical protein KM043_016663 [Ampulex compressa]